MIEGGDRPINLCFGGVMREAQTQDSDIRIYAHRLQRTRRIEIATTGKHTVRGKFRSERFGGSVCGNRDGRRAQLGLGL